MAAAAVHVLGERVQTGLVVAPTGAVASSRLYVMVADHPVPGPGSEAAGRQALKIASTVPDDGYLLVLLSGGASSLMVVPASGITLEDKQMTTDTLLKRGGDIGMLNAVRKHLSAIKGGQLALRTRSPSLTLALSDVIGDTLSVIGSGPTVGDETTFADAWSVVRATAAESTFPAPVIARLRAGVRGDVPETPKPGDPRLANHRARVIGGRANAMSGAAEAAQSRGYEVVVQDAPVTGEARAAGPAQARSFLESRSRRPCCLISSGETTVYVRGTGRGGRNQELALAVVRPLAGVEPPIVCASLGTDGIDGPTDAAGAVVDSTSLSRAARADLSPEAFLEKNDSYAFFDALGDLLRRGPTGTNVGDLQVFLSA